MKKGGGADCSSLSEEETTQQASSTITRMEGLIFPSHQNCSVVDNEPSADTVARDVIQAVSLFAALSSQINMRSFVPVVLLLATAAQALPHPEVQSSSTNK